MNESHEIKIVGEVEGSEADAKNMIEIAKQLARFRQITSRLECATDSAMRLDEDIKTLQKQKSMLISQLWEVFNHWDASAK